MLKNILLVYGTGMIFMAFLCLTYAFVHRPPQENPMNCLDSLMIPESFCPNCGDQSSSFEPTYICEPDLVDLNIFNRWGQIIYASHDVNFKWRGIDSKGNRAEPGTYFYTIKCAKETNMIQRQGYVQLMEADCLDSLAIPNSFTPNSDGFNDAFQIEFPCIPEQFEINIYNRWGEVVFNSDDPNFKWYALDSANRELPSGVYVYILNYTFLNKENMRNGNITVVR